MTRVLVWIVEMFYKISIIIFMTMYLSV